MNVPVQKVFLVGMMGVGKTTAGRLLAEKLGWPHLDSDEEVVRVAGKPFPQLWEEGGEPGFRSLETKVVSELAASPGEAVVALGGGAVLDPQNRETIKGAGLVVWLRADPATLSERVGDGRGRPLLKSGPAKALKHLSDTRAPLYESVADLVFDVDRMNPREVAERVASAVKGQPCAS
ncbi:MAG TPA: shikimate kinase [Acidimicrobiales bacterium]|nr:shikimate kinase [Acidimicrobiales bacterium]